MAKIDAPLTLLVTGTGMRIGMRTNEPIDKVLLLRTEDATLHFDKNSDFGKLAHALVDNYNNYSKLVEENERLKEILETCYLFVNDEVENNRGNKYAKSLQEEIYKILK